MKQSRTTQRECWKEITQWMLILMGLVVITFSWQHFTASDINETSSSVYERYNLGKKEQVAVTRIATIKLQQHPELANNPREWRAYLEILAQSYVPIQ